MDKEKAKLMKLSTYFTVLGVSIIIMLKTYGWFKTDSVTILASLTDSLLDICVSIMNLLAVHYSLQPADQEHRFGHGKIEDIVVFLQAIFFSFSGFALIFESIKRIGISNDLCVETSDISIFIMVCSTIINIVIVLFQRYVISKSNSQVIKADSMHYFVDFLSNIVAIVGILLVSYFKMTIFDAFTAVVIAGYIIYNATQFIKTSFNNLMDRELDESTKFDIKTIIKSNPYVRNFHDLKTRSGGGKTFIQFHLVLDKKMTLEKAHEIVSEVEDKIIIKIPNAEIIVHQDPDGIDEDISYID